LELAPLELPPLEVLQPRLCEQAAAALEREEAELVGACAGWPRGCLPRPAAAAAPASCFRQRACLPPWPGRRRRATRCRLDPAPPNPASLAARAQAAEQEMTRALLQALDRRRAALRKLAAAQGPRSALPVAAVPGALARRQQQVPGDAEERLLGWVLGPE
jgi:hypothetical protein